MLIFEQIASPITYHGICALTVGGKHSAKKLAAYVDVAAKSQQQIIPRNALQPQAGVRALMILTGDTNANQPVILIH